jgi:hypothetical protein
LFYFSFNGLDPLAISHSELTRNSEAYRELAGFLGGGINPTQGNTNPEEMQKYINSLSGI